MEYNESGIIPDNDPEKLWSAQKIKDTTLHPDTNKVIPLPFRVSAFVPMNAFICMGMLLPGAGLANQVFWQWINQSYNLCLNHANRNASNTMTTTEIGATYAAAVTASCGVAVGLSRVVHYLKPSPIKNVLGLLVPFFSVSIAGIVNVFMMRRNEIFHGINVKRDDDKVVGRSRKAGISALQMVATSRIVTSIPVMTVVPFTLNGLMKTQWLKSRPYLVNPLNILLITIALQTGLPVAIALFPQSVGVPVSSLEKEFQNLVDEKGNKVEMLYYNRGL